MHHCLQGLLTAALLTAVSGALAAQSYRPVLTPAPGDAEVSVEIERHANGQLAKRVHRRNGQPHGLWQEWDSAGRVRLTAEWRDGRGEGVWMYFHPNGLVSERSWVTDDVWHGPTEGWHANGQKAFEGMFHRGQKAAPFRYWTTEGIAMGPVVELLSPRPEPARVVAEGWPPGFNVWDVSFSPELETVFVGTGDNDGNRRRIMMRRWRNGQWQPVERAPFADTSVTEGSPVMSADGEWLYFSSDRHVRREPRNTRRDLYRVSRASGWKTVERITNTPLYGEVALSLAVNGVGVLWTDRRRDGAARMGLYEVRLQPGVGGTGARIGFVADLSTLHTGDASGEAFPALAPDGSYLLFSNYDVGGTGSKEDSYITRRTPAGWSKPRRLTGAINSLADDTPSQLLAGGGILLFRSSRDGAHSLYTVSTEAVLPAR